MGHTRQSLAKDLGALGLKAGDIVMVHASVRAVGKIFGGPDEIHLAIEDAIGPSGTMMMVAGCPEGVDDVGRGVLTPEEEAEILEKQPAFDAKTARANRDLGALAEFFRSYPGTICSDNAPVRISARGGRAELLTRDQPWDYGFGRGSPFERLVDARGWLLLLGSDHDEVTLMHYVEHVTDFPGKKIARYLVPVMRAGKRAWVPCEEFDTSGAGVHANWPDRFFALITDAFIGEFHGTDVCHAGKVGDADAFLLDAHALVKVAAPIMVRQARTTEPVLMLEPQPQKMV
jgi:aminoglycoside 3-N-acetyltransferase